jgi:hypothetical protein
LSKLIINGVYSMADKLTSRMKSQQRHQSVQSGFSAIDNGNFQRNMDYISETAKALSKMSKKGQVPPGLDQVSMSILMSLMQVAARMGRQK